MKCDNPVKDQQVLVLGLGGSGMAAAHLLRDRGAVVTVREDRRNDKTKANARELESLGIEVQWGPDYPGDRVFQTVVLSPGIESDAPLVRPHRESGAEIISEVELAWRYHQGKTVAITGTNGKTTTTGLIESVLQSGGYHAVACGNIGLPFSEVVARTDPPEIAVVEVSSFQLETIVRFSPEVAVYLNLTPDHLDRYPDMDAYRQAKERIVMNMGAEQSVVVRAGLEIPKGDYRVITFTSEDVGAPYTFSAGYLCEEERPLLAQEETSLCGPHQAENQLAALAVGRLFRVTDEERASALKSYRALPHRCEVVAQSGGTTFVNDSKATNLDAMVQAIQGYRGKVHLIAGGKDKGFDYRASASVIAAHCAGVYLIGEAAPIMQEAWEEQAPCRLCATLEEATEKAAEAAAAGAVVLLSPGCSSFDMFQDYQDRGERFRQAVHRLLEAKPDLEKKNHE
jgi:UDP-N-acetylmuramoylalanine--D-glutamate ligase